MKRLLVVLLFSTLAVAQMPMGGVTVSYGGGVSAPVIVQKTHCLLGSQSVTTFTCAFGSNFSSTSNMVLIESAIFDGGSPTGTAPAMSIASGCASSSAFTAGDTQKNNASRSVGVRWYYATVTATGACTVTINFGTTTNVAAISVIGYEISGQNASPIDAFCSGTGGTGADPVCSAAITPSTNDLVISFVFTTSAYNWTVGSGYTFDVCFTDIFNTTCTGNSSQGISQHKATSSATTPTMHPDSGSFWSTQGLAIKP